MKLFMDQSEVSDLPVGCSHRKVHVYFQRDSAKVNISFSLFSPKRFLANGIPDIPLLLFNTLWWTLKMIMN